MPLLQLEAYLMRGDSCGYPESHWEAVIEQYEELINDKNGSSTREVIGRHTELALSYNVLVSMLDMCEGLYNKEVVPGRVAYSPTLAASLAERFKPLTFSKETITEDIGKARSKLKALKKQVEEAGDLLPTNEGPANSTFFDDVLRAYGQAYQYAPPHKSVMFVTEFTGYYNDLQRKMELDQKRNHTDE